MSDDEAGILEVVHAFDSLLIMSIVRAEILAAAPEMKLVRQARPRRVRGHHQSEPES